MVSNYSACELVVIIVNHTVWSIKYKTSSLKVAICSSNLRKIVALSAMMIIDEHIYMGGSGGTMVEMSI